MSRGALVTCALALVAVVVLVLSATIKKASAQGPGNLSECRRVVYLVGYSEKDRDFWAKIYAKQDTPFKQYLKGKAVTFETLPGKWNPIAVQKKLLPEYRKADPTALYLFVYKDKRYALDFEFTRQKVLPTSTPGQASAFALVNEGWGMVLMQDNAFAWRVSHELLHLVLVGTWHTGWQDPAELAGQAVKRWPGAENLPWWKCALKVDKL